MEKYQIKEQEPKIAEIEKKATVEATRSSKKVYAKVAILNVVNLLLIVSLFYLLSRVPKLAQSAKELRSQQIVAQESADAAILTAEITRNSDKIASISKVFVDDEGFLELLDVLSDEEVITNFTFPGSDPVLNSQKQRGVPMSITFAGSQEQINASLARVQSLPYFLLPTNVELSGSTEQMELKYNAFLLVDESFSQN